MSSVGNHFLLHCSLNHVLLSSLSPLLCRSFRLCFRRQNVSLSGWGRPGLSDVSACSFLPCMCVCVCVPKCILFTTSGTFHTLPTSHPVRRLASSLPPTSCLWLQLFLPFTSQPTPPSTVSPFSFSSSPISPPPAGFRCYRTVKRRRWIRPLKGTSMSVRTTLCRSWRRPFWERSRGWRETMCAVTAERPVSVQRDRKTPPTAHNPKLDDCRWQDLTSGLHSLTY